MGGPRQVLRLPSLKHTTVYNPDNDLIWEYETDWTRSAWTDMCTFSMGVRRGVENGHLPPPEIGTKKKKFLENVKLAV